MTEAAGPAAGADEHVLDVSVVIPTRNRARLLSRAIASVLAQEDVRLEVVVVDDDSDDETPRLLERLDDTRLRILRLSPRRGVSRARNAALGEARGAWVAFLDDDDFWAPHKLGLQLRAGHERDAALVYARAVVVDEGGRVKRVTDPATPEQLDRALLETNTIGTPSGVLTRTELVRAVGGFDDGLSTFADWDLWLRLLQHGEAGFVDESLFAYVEHPMNMHVTQMHSARAELRHLAEKHRELCRARNVRFGSLQLSRWLIGQYRPQGQRLDAAREYASIGLRHRSARDLGRAAGVLLGEPVLRVGRAVVGAASTDDPKSSPPAPDWLPDALAGNAFGPSPRES